MRNISAYQTLPEFIEKPAQIYPQKVALIFEDQEYTYQEIKKKVDTIASQIISKTKKGDVVGILLPNSPEFLFAYFAVLQAGCIALLFPVNISDKTLTFQIEKTDPRLIISKKTYQEKLKRVKAEEKMFDIESLKALKKSSARKISPDTISTIIFTSGTTSEPKGVTLQHKNVVQATKNIIEYLKWSEKDIDVNISQLSHSFGLGHVHSIFAVGGTVVLFRDAINLKKILQTIKDRKATTFGAVPAILRLLCGNFLQLFKDTAKNLRCIHTNTSLLEPELINTILENFPKTNFSYYYGLSEASRSTFITFNTEKSKISSVGRASPNVSIEIFDSDDTSLPANKIGEICIKGPHVISSYWKNPVASKLIRKGWLHTGDMGYLDEDGYLYYKGRKDDIINVSGEKVSPEEIEYAAKKVEGIVDAAAIGIEDRLLGEVVKLYVVASEDTYNEKVLQTELKKTLESYKVPRLIEKIAEIPKTENGKVVRNKLKSQYS